MYKNIVIPVDTPEIYRGWGLELPIINDGSLAKIPTGDSDVAVVFSIFRGRHPLNGHLYARAALWAIWDLVHFTDIAQQGIPIYIVCDESFRAEVEPYFALSGFRNVLYMPSEAYDNYSLHNKRFVSYQHAGIQPFSKILNMDAFLWWWTRDFEVEPYPLYDWLSGWQDELFVTKSLPYHPSRVALDACRIVNESEFFEVVATIEERDPKVSREFWCEHPQLSVHGACFGITRTILESDWFLEGIQTLSEVTYSDEVAMSVLLNTHLSASDFYMLEVPWVSTEAIVGNAQPEQNIGIVVTDWQNGELSKAWLARRQFLHQTYGKLAT